MKAILLVLVTDKRLKVSEYSQMDTKHVTRVLEYFAMSACMETTRSVRKVSDLFLQTSDGFQLSALA